jgi:hypothetical protein
MPNRSVLTICFAALSACATAAHDPGPVTPGAAPHASPSSSSSPSPSPSTAVAVIAHPELGYTTSRTGDLHDFDWIAGAWKVSNRRLKARGVGSDEWDEFPAVDCGRVHLGGVVNVDELLFPTKGWSGVTFRTFDVAKRQWSIYWVNSRNGQMFPPVVGGFDGARGEFYGDDEDNGRPVKVRFVWTRLGPDRAHWEQAFSADGRTWEVNWTNDFERADPAICVDGRPRS